MIERKIQNGDPAAIELIPEFYSFNEASDQHGQRWKVLNIHTENLGVFQVPIHPRVAKAVGAKLTEFAEANGE